MDLTKVALVLGFSLAGLSCVAQGRSWNNVKFAVSLFQDWDYRYQREPPRREFVNIQDNEPFPGVRDMTFTAFGKVWTMELKLNRVLIGNGFTLDYITRDGKVRKRSNIQQGCWYLGTVTAGNDEVGYASISTCYNNFQGYIITNKNDYTFNPLVPKNVQARRKKRSDDMDDERLRTKRYPIADTNSLDGKWVDARFKPLTIPFGRELHVELALSIEKTYKAKFESEISTDENLLLQHLVLLAQNVQLWYLHPTLGYIFWITLRKVVIVEDVWLPASEMTQDKDYLGAVCNWLGGAVPETRTYDGVIFMSEDLTYWKGGEGLGMVGGMCDTNGYHCLGVGKKGFQYSTLTRVIAHEMGHLLGMADAYYPPISKLCYTGLMRQGVYEDNDWGTCGVQRMENFIYVRSKTCVQNSNTPSVASRITPPVVPVNVAWRAKAYQSSTYHNEKVWGAWLATDGALTGVPYLDKNATLGSCTQTLEENNPWLVIELPDHYKETPIKAIHIYNREDCCADRLRNFEVRVGNNGNFHNNPVIHFQASAVPGGKYGMININGNGARGKYISIQLKHRGILTVCEVNVFQGIRAPAFTHDAQPCLDEDTYCHSHREKKPGGRCPPNDWTTNRCHFTCGQCARAGIYVPPVLNQQVSQTTPNPKPSCMDSNAYCAHWKAMGWCDIHGWTCKKSCGGC